MLTVLRRGRLLHFPVGSRESIAVGFIFEGLNVPIAHEPFPDGDTSFNLFGGERVEFMSFHVAELAHSIYVLPNPGRDRRTSVLQQLVDQRVQAFSSP